jgi:serine/threonine protein kinase
MPHSSDPSLATHAASVPVTSACFRCNAPLDSGARFCQVCGLSVSGEQTAPLPTLLQIVRQATLGEYEIVREVGQGGMATVYLARELALDRLVAIKVMSPQFVHGEQMIARFKREAKTAAGLTHPHIIPIYSVRESQQLVYFVMKYVSGRSLDQILHDVGALPFPMVRSILADIGSALDYAHRQGVVHRDVKPGNIMIDEEGFAVITDFGIARAIEGESLTRSGTTVGTPSYLSPEACSGEVVGPAADQYALGVVGYEMVTGHLPFTADSSLGMMYAQVHTPPRPSDQLRPDCPTDLRNTLMRMLEKTPTDRFPSMREAAQSVAGKRMSGRQPLDDESVRSHIGLLAAPRPSRPVNEARRTPSTPSPLPRLSGPSIRPKRRKVQFTQVLVGLLLAALGAGLAYVAIQARNEGLVVADTAPVPAPVPPPAASPEELRVDSLFLVAKGGAEYARQRAVVAGAEAPALAAGDSLRTQAESLAGLGHKLEATALIWRAANFWTAAERTRGEGQASLKPPASVSPGPRPGPPERASEPSTAPSRTETYAQPPLPDSAQIVEFYADLERAVESRQLNEVRQLLPNLTDTEERDWRSLFEDSDVERITASFQVQNVTRGDGLKAFARVAHDIRVTRKNSKVETKKKSLEFATLTLGPQGWRQILSEKAKP